MKPIRHCGDCFHFPECEAEYGVDPYDEICSDFINKWTYPIPRASLRDKLEARKLMRKLMGLER